MKPPDTRLNYDQLQTGVAAANRHFALIRKKDPEFTMYLVLSLPSGQARIGSSPKEILKEPMRLVRRTPFADYLDEIRPRLRALEQKESKPKVIRRIFQFWKEPEAFRGMVG